MVGKQVSIGEADDDVKGGGRELGRIKGGRWRANEGPVEVADKESSWRGVYQLKDSLQRWWRGKLTRRG